ncbi:leukosialin [Erinaceus europaeus]|uniref:Leukosialin n=1 Tax=Erinaceus europaeus TaxID=9365 RepID=A0ABM3VXH6_ERIEU|nr:leukosialin [Erinaceus europaeus]
MEMTSLLLLLFLMGSWAQESPEPMASTELPTPEVSSLSLVLQSTEALDFNSSTSSPAEIRDIKVEDNDTSDQKQTPPPPTPDAGQSTSDPGNNPNMTSSMPTVSLEVSTEKDPESLGMENSTHHSAVNIATDSPDLHTVTEGTNASRDQDMTSGTTGLPVTTPTYFLDTSSETKGLSVTTANNFLKTPGLSVSLTTSSPEISSGTSGHSVSTAATSLAPSKGTSSSVSGPNPSATTFPQSSPPLTTSQESRGGLLFPVLVALLVAIVLVILLLLWRRRQKGRTGVLMLSGAGKRNGVVDTWAGPTRVPDEEAPVATATSSEDKDDKGAGVPDREGSGRRPTLTTFFGRRKSRQGSVALEELKACSDPNHEEDPLVGSEDVAVESPISKGPGSGNEEEAPE